MPSSEGPTLFKPNKGKGRESPLLTLLQDQSRVKLVKQGAEAKVYKVTSLFEDIAGPLASTSSALPALAQPLLLKHRFSKSYRHATLDAQLTKTRIAHESKCLLRCLKSGRVDVPKVKAIDAANGIIVLEWIDGPGSLREVLGGLPEEDELVEEHGPDSSSEDGDEIDEVTERLNALGLNEDAIMHAIGHSIGSMHCIDVIHGDLTTSNMLLRSPASVATATPSRDPRVVLIDFGLSYISTLPEDKAVDLYVLERALASTHPEPEDRRKEDRFIEKILAGYKEAVGEKDWVKIQRRLKDVRMRGRKRSMVG